ncbi:MAG: hypothetical protein FJX75_13495 [Armatimonadetes bacterium]|nr:hypothetical protein [Armatimonadota bacterium]
MSVPLLLAPVGAAEEGGEWTAERALACWKPMVRPVQHVGIPGYQFQTGVLWDGSLVFGPLGFRELKVMQAETADLGDSLLHVSVAFGEPPRFVDRKGANAPAIRRWLEEGRLPILTVETTDGDLLWRETVFAHLLGRKADEGMTPEPSDVLVTHALFHVSNTGETPQQAHLWLHLGDVSQVHFGYKCGIGEEVAPAIPHRFEAPLGLLGERVRYVILPPAEGTVKQQSDGSLPGAIEWTVSLEPKAEATLEVRLPYGTVDRATAERIVAIDSEAALREVRRFWKRLEQGPSQIETPDAFVNDYVAAVPAQMAQQIGYRRHSDVWMYKTSPNHYEGYWPCNAAKALPTLDLRGLTDLSRPVLQSFVETQTEDVGALCEERRGGDRDQVQGEGYAKTPGFLGNFGEWTANTLLLSHGLELWALSAHYRITRDREWLGEGKGSPLQAIVDGCDWLRVQRRRTMREEDGRKVAHYGLLPAASAHDWLSGNTIFNDAFCIYGMTEAARMLREIGHPRAEEFSAELAHYRRCLHDRYVEARDRAKPIPQADGSLLPYVPRDVYELDWRGLDWTYTGYSPVRAGAWGALDPHDELVEQSLAFLEQGMPQGEGPYFGAHKQFPDTADANWGHISDPHAARHHLWRHYVEYETMWPVGGPLFLARDDLPRFFEWLFNNLAVVLHRDWRVGVESLDGVPSCAPGDGERWQMIRRMFVNETGGYDGSEQSLFLLQAIPREWLKPGAHLAARDMRTFFGGQVDLHVKVAKDGDEVRVKAGLDLAVAPKGITIRLRSGDGRPLREATVNGKAVEVLAGDTVRLPEGKSAEYVVAGRFARN